MTPRDRVRAALAHTQPDVTPCDYFATPEIHQALARHYGLTGRAFFPRFIACGMDALQAIQPRAAGMDPYDLKREFAGRIALHGAVDVQGWLQRSTPRQIEQEVDRLMDEGAPAEATSSPPATRFNPIRRSKTSWPSTKPQPSAAGTRSCEPKEGMP